MDDNLRLQRGHLPRSARGPDSKRGNWNETTSSLLNETWAIPLGFPVPPFGNYPYPGVHQVPPQPPGERYLSHCFERRCFDSALGSGPREGLSSGGNPGDFGRQIHIRSAPGRLSRRRVERYRWCRPCSCGGPRGVSIAL